MPIRTLTEPQIAYVAGVIDGEGTITLSRQHRKENRRPVLSISNTELSLLRYVRAVVGAGKITAKRETHAHHSPSYSYTLQSRQDLTLLRMVAPYLRRYTRRRAQLLIEQYLRYTPRNGRYTLEQSAGRRRMEERFFKISVRRTARTPTA